MNTRRLAPARWLLCVLLGGGWLSAQAPPAALPATIPIFPLPDVVLFPHIALTVYVFEPRYRTLLYDALQGDGIIGMVLLQPGYEADYEGRPPVYPVGCAGLIVDVAGLPDGRLQVLMQGLQKFRITGEDSDRAYRVAHVDPIAEVADDRERTDLAEQRRQLEAILLRREANAGPKPRLFPGTSDEDFFNSLAQHMKVEGAERQRLLEQPSVLRRAEALIALLGTLMTPH